MAGVRLGQASSPGRGPLDYLVRPCLCRVRVAARGREYRLPVVEHPRLQPLATAGPGELESFVRELLSFVPPAGHEGIEAQIDQRAGSRPDGAAGQAIADHPQ